MGNNLYKRIELTLCSCQGLAEIDYKTAIIAHHVINVHQLPCACGDGPLAYQPAFLAQISAAAASINQSDLPVV